MTSTPSLLPASDSALLVRTAFDDDTAWASVLVGVRTPSENGFLAFVEVVDDLDHRGLSADRLRTLLPVDESLPFFFVADEPAMAGPDHPLLVVPVPGAESPDLDEPPQAIFRVAAASLWVVENNLSIGNTEWMEFAEHCDSDGVFRYS